MKDRPVPLDYSIPDDHPSRPEVDSDRVWELFDQPAEGHGRSAGYLVRGVGILLALLLVTVYIRMIVIWLTR